MHRQLIKFVIALGLFGFMIPVAANADEILIPYYGSTFYELTLKSSRDQDLVEQLRKILTAKHIRRANQLDEITHFCDGAERDCYGHTPVGYKSARKIIMGSLHLVNNAAGYAIREVYCQKDFDKNDLAHTPPTPGEAPDDKVINVEHTWPQSRFNSSMDSAAQKSDLHHLFPTHSEMNRIRGNMKFGDVDYPAMDLPCDTAKMGSIKGLDDEYFEPPVAHKGNVARALFYFSVRYKLRIDKDEETFLRKWHQEDPVDQEELTRNNLIQRMQGNRNPFVDFPQLANSISDF
jgi:endonuclease I